MQYGVVQFDHLVHWVPDLDTAVRDYQARTARLLPRPLKGRKTGPVFATERKARVQLLAADLDEHGHARQSCQQAAALFSDASGGATLHQLRHSALTHDAEDAPVRRC